MQENTGKTPRMRTVYDPDTGQFHEEPWLEHSETECCDCIFVSSKEEILRACSETIKKKASWSFMDSINNLHGTLNGEDKLIEAGRFTMPQWSGHLMFYLFFCSSCGEFTVDYVHGSREAYIACENCDGRFTLKSKRFYTNDGRKAPPSLWHELKHMIGSERMYGSYKSWFDRVEPLGLRSERILKVFLRPDNQTLD